MGRLVDDLRAGGGRRAGTGGHEQRGSRRPGARGGGARTQQQRVRIRTTRVSAGPICANSSEIRRAVRNLIENAVAYAASAVELAVVTTGREVVLDIRDDGPGVPPGKRERIFDRFHRGDTARTHGVAGSGPGLSIARSAAERAGGRLELVEAPGGARLELGEAQREDGDERDARARDGADDRGAPTVPQGL